MKVAEKRSPDGNRGRLPKLTAYEKKNKLIVTYSILINANSMPLGVVLVLIIL